MTWGRRPTRVLILGTVNHPHVEQLSLAMHERGFDPLVGGNAEPSQPARPRRTLVGAVAHVRWIRQVGTGESEADRPDYALKWTASTLRRRLRAADLAARMLRPVGPQSHICAAISGLADPLGWPRWEDTLTLNGCRYAAVIPLQRNPAGCAAT